MAVYSRPPLTPDTIPNIGPKIFNADEIAGWLRHELQLDEHKTWRRTNSVLICGTAASGKTTLVQKLAKDLPHMKYLSEEEFFNKEYRARIPSEYARDMLKTYEIILEEYAFSRLNQAVQFLKKLSEDKAPFDAGHLVIGGLLQSLVTLCAYTHTFSVDPESHKIVLPPPLLEILQLSMQLWAPRAIIFLDAPLEERIVRAKKQSEPNQVEWEKRILPFQHDQVIRELTANTINQLCHHAKARNIPLSAIQYTGEYPDLKCRIYGLQDHSALERHMAMLTDTYYTEQ